MEAYIVIFDTNSCQTFGKTLSKTGTRFLSSQNVSCTKFLKAVRERSTDFLANEFMILVVQYFD